MMKKIVLVLCLCLVLLEGGTVLANVINPNQIVSTNVNVGLAEDELISEFSSARSHQRKAKVKYNHKAKIHWDRGKRAVSAWTQATRNKKKINSYSRARFEYPWYMGGGSYFDTGRIESKNRKASYAKTKSEIYRDGSSGKAATYYGT